MRSGWFTNKDEIDYEITQKGEPFKGHDISRKSLVAMRVIAVLIVVYGVQTSFERDMLSRLTVYNPFGWSYNESTMGFLIDYLSLMGIYISGTHYVLKFVRKQEKAMAYIER
nr:hypothetical protein [Priestia megaterium]